MKILEKLRDHFNNWQDQGHEEEPPWYSNYIDNHINKLSNVELIELIEMLMEEEEC